MIHQEFIDYPGLRLDEHFFVEDPATQKRTLAIDSQRAERMLPSKALPQSVRPESIRYLSIWMESPERYHLPAWIRDLPNLINLQIPAAFIKTLKPGDLPESLAVLRIDGAGKATFPLDVHLPNLRWLLTSDDVVRFRRSSFPALFCVTLKLDKTRAMVREIVAAPSLRAVGLYPFDTPDQFAELSESSIQFLNVMRGKVNSLEEITRLPRLTNLSLVGLNRIEDLTPLLALRDLREVVLLDCRRIKGVEVFTRMKALRKLHVKNCGAHPWAEIKAALEGRLEELILI